MRTMRTSAEFEDFPRRSVHGCGLFQIQGLRSSDPDQGEAGNEGRRGCRNLGELDHEQEKDRSAKTATKSSVKAQRALLSPSSSTGLRSGKWYTSGSSRNRLPVLLAQPPFSGNGSARQSKRPRMRKENSAIRLEDPRSRPGEADRRRANSGSNVAAAISPQLSHLGEEAGLICRLHGIACPARL